MSSPIYLQTIDTFLKSSAPEGFVWAGVYLLSNLLPSPSSGSPHSQIWTFECMYQISDLIPLNPHLLPARSQKSPRTLIAFFTLETKTTPTERASLLPQTDSLAAPNLYWIGLLPLSLLLCGRELGKNPMLTYIHMRSERESIRSTKHNW